MANGTTSTGPAQVTAHQRQQCHADLPCHTRQSSTDIKGTLANGNGTGLDDGPAISIPPNTTVYLYGSVVRNHSSEGDGKMG